MQPVIVFPFRLPKAGAVAIQRALHTTDGASRGHVSRTSALREELVAALTPAGGGQVSTALVLQKAERYLPSLCGLACALTNQPRLHLNEPLNFKWTSSLRKTKHKTTGSRKMYLDWDFKFELVMTLNTLGLGYARRASEVLYSGAGGGQPDEDLKLAALLLRKAAGVFTHLADTEIPRWVGVADRETAVECNHNIAKALSIVCLALAQQLTIKKALADGMKKGIVAKLSAEVCHMLENALSLAKMYPNQRLVNKHFLKYLELQITMNKAVCGRLLAASHYEQEKLGHAVSYARLAYDTIQTIKPFKEANPLFPYTREVQAVQNDVGHVFRLYNMQNNHVWVQKEVDSRVLGLPEGKSVVKIEPFLLPEPEYTDIF